MFRKLASYLYVYELIMGICLFIIAFLFYLIFPGPITFARSLPMCGSWLGAFLIGDWMSRKLGEGSILPHRKNQLHKFKRLALAAYIMNLFSDATGAWLLKLWYYPALSNVFLYIFVFGPLGYVLFGYILYVFYRLFKRHWDHNVLHGRMRTLQRRIFLTCIYGQLIIGIIGMFFSLSYYQEFVRLHGIIWYTFSENIQVSVNVVMPMILWISTFFLLEFACFLLKRETLTRDLIRGNMLPFVAILLSSVVCIVLVEWFNAPFQAWRFTNWPYQHIQLFSIPLVAYVMWPMQYLLLLPLIRLFDGKNEENVW